MRVPSLPFPTLLQVKLFSTLRESLGISASSRARDGFTDCKQQRGTSAAPQLAPTALALGPDAECAATGVCLLPQPAPLMLPPAAAGVDLTTAVGGGSSLMADRAVCFSRARDGTLVGLIGAVGAVGNRCMRRKSAPAAGFDFVKMLYKQVSRP